MLSAIARSFLFHYIDQARATYPGPLIWNAKAKKFLLEDSLKFRIFNKLALLLDILSCFVVLITHIWKSEVGKQPNFQSSDDLLWPAMLNVVFDLNSIRTRKESQQLFNAFLKLTTSRGR